MHVSEHLKHAPQRLEVEDSQLPDEPRREDLNYKLNYNLVICS